MSGFSITGAGLSAITLTRAHPGAVLVWSIILTIVSFATTVLLIPVMGPYLTAMRDAGGQTPGDPGAYMGMLGGLLGAYALMMLAFVVLYGILGTAVNRMVQRPDAGGAGFLKLGAEEWRGIVVILVQGLSMAGCYLVGVIVVSIVSLPFAMQGPSAMVVPMAIGYGVLLLALMALGTKFSLALSDTFAKGRIEIFGSWSLTRGRFWPMFAAQLLSALVLVVFYALLIGVRIGASYALGGGLDLSSLLAPDMSSFSAFFTPDMIIYQLIAGLLSGVVVLCMFAPAAVIYRDLFAGRTEDVFA